jgi:hypothetical protein
LAETVVRRSGWPSAAPTCSAIAPKGARKQRMDLGAYRHMLQVDQ